MERLHSGREGQTASNLLAGKEKFRLLIDARSEESIPLSFSEPRPRGGNIFEFLVHAHDRVGTTVEILSVISKHNVNINGSYSTSTNESKTFYKTIFCEFANADCTVEQLALEIKKLPPTIDVKTANVSNAIFGKFLFPMVWRKNQRVMLLEMVPFLKAEKNLVRLLGSGGETMMFEQGRIYAKEYLAPFQEFALKGEQPMLNNIVESFRSTGLGLLALWRYTRGFVVIVGSPPLIDDSDFQSRFFLGIICGSLEYVYHNSLQIESTEYDKTKDELVINFLEGPQPKA